MVQAKKGDKVKVHYTGKLEDGSVFDTSNGGEPLEFTIGGEDVIPAFEAAIVGMKAGDSKSIKITSGDAYGPYRDELAIEVDRSQFPKNIVPTVGEKLELHKDGCGDEDCDSAHCDTLVVTITDVSDSKVKLDANHPLAGKDLTFDVELIEIG